MRCLVRAGLAAALVAFVFLPALAVDKTFRQSGLDEAAIKLEAQIKSDAGNVSKPAATLRRDADAAFQKNDFRAGMLVLGQLVAAAPDDATSWLRLSRAVLQIKPRDEREKARLLDRASTAAYIASTKNCAPSTGSGCSTIRSIPIRFHRAPASSFPRSCRAGAPTSLRLSPLRLSKDQRSPRARSSFASRASSTANVTR